MRIVLAGWLAGWPDGRMAGWPDGGMAGWMAGWLDGWMAGWADRQAGWRCCFGWEIFFFDDRPSLQSQVGCVNQDSTNVGTVAGIQYSEICTGKEMGDEEPCHSTKILIFSFIWAGLACFVESNIFLQGVSLCDFSLNQECWWAMICWGWPQI